MNFTKKMIRRFVKDYSFPVKVHDPELFQYYADVLSEYSDYASGMTLLRSMTDGVGENGLDKEWMRTVDEAVEWLRSCDGFSKLMGDLPPMAEVTKDVAKGDVYKPENDSKWFLSVDLIQANFNAMKWWTDCFDEGETYEDWMGRFTSYEYMKRSKYVRQVIFGKLASKRLQVIQRHVIGRVVEDLKRMTGELPMAMTADEVVYGFDDQLTADKMMLAAVAVLSPMLLKMDVYCLRQLAGRDCYVALRSGGDLPVPTGTFEIRKTPSHLFMQAYKYVTDGELDERDMIFEHEKQLARFVEPYFPWEG